jgi:hypothetical protein
MSNKRKRRLPSAREFPPSPSPCQPFPIVRLDIDQTRRDFAERWQERAERIKSRGVLPPEGWVDQPIPDIKRDSDKSLSRSAQAVLERLQNGRRPGKNEDWKTFQRAIEKKGTRLSIRQLDRLVRRLMPK